MNWQFLSTGPLLGQENMDYDRRTLEAVALGKQEPTVRFFRWSEPTVSYGRLQDPSKVASLVPKGWKCVVRPTGGGIVFHDKDLCVSLAWPDDAPPLPPRAADLYEWIHGVLMSGLQRKLTIEMLACCDAPKSSTAFAEKQCFVEPVGSDLLVDKKKVVGGALFHRKGGWLYQGSIQLPEAWGFEPALRDELKERLCNG